MKGILFVILACLLWATDTLIRYPLLSDGVSPITIVFYEHLILVIIFSYFLLKNTKNIGELKLSHIFYFFIVGGVGSALSTLLFTRAFTYANPSSIILLQKLQPLVVIILARFVLKEPIQKKFILWASVCLFGGLLIGHQEISSLFLDDGTNIVSEGVFFGYSLALLAVIGWGATTVFGKKLSLSGYSEIQIMSGRFFFGFVCILPIFLSSNGSKIVTEFNFIKLCLLVLISGILAMYFYYKGLKQISARACSLAEMFFPFCAVIVNWMVLGKTLTLLQLVGGGILLAGSSIIQIKKY